MLWKGPAKWIAIDIAYTICFKGHALRFEEIEMLRAWNIMRRQTKRDRRVQRAFEQAWENRAVIGGEKRNTHPINNLYKLMKAKGMEWVSQYRVKAPYLKRDLRLDEDAEEVWQHEAREALRRWRWWNMPDRKDLPKEETRNGIDYEMSARLVQKLAKLEPGVDLKGINASDRGMLVIGLSGGVPTKQRLNRVTIAQLKRQQKTEEEIEKEATPPWCDSCLEKGIKVEETTEHLYMDCPTYRPLMREVWEMTTEKERKGWPKCFRCCGIWPEDNTHIKLEEDHFKEEEVEVERPPDRTVEDMEEEKWETTEDGVRRLKVATDGAARRASMGRLKRCGAGVFFAEKHSHNARIKMETRSASAQAAEVRAFLRAMRWAPCPVLIICDNKYVVDHFNKLRNGGKVEKGIAHRKWWLTIQGAVSTERGKHFYMARKVPSHIPEK